MTTVTCPACGRDGSTSADLQDGAKVRCPACHHKFFYVALDLLDLLDTAATPSPPEVEPEPQEKPAPLEVIVVGRDPAKSVPWEPPPYWLLEIWSYVHYLAAAGLALGGIVAAQGTAAAVTAVTFFLYLGGIGALFASGLLVHLAVDVARNIRAQRYKL